MVTNDVHLIVSLVEAGVGLGCLIGPRGTGSLRRGTLRRVLEPDAAEVPGWFLDFPSRDQVSPALRAFIDVAHAATAVSPDCHAAGDGDPSPP